MRKILSVDFEVGDFVCDMHGGLGERLLEEKFNVINHTKFYFPNLDAAHAWEKFMHAAVSPRNRCDNKHLHVIDASNTFGHIVAMYCYDHAFGGIIEFEEKRPEAEVGY